jgi:YggT family protein
MLVETLGFLITVVFDCYLSILLLRFALQWLGARYYNPISQFTVKLTEPLLKPLRKLIPNFGGMDWASLSLLLVLALIKNGLLLGLAMQDLPFFPGLILLAVVNLLSLMLSLLFYAIIIRVLLSWLAPRTFNPAAEIIFQLTEPLLLRIRRWVPPLAGIDLSPLIILIVLQWFNLVCLSRLLDFSRGLAILG